MWTFWGDLRHGWANDKGLEHLLFSPDLAERLIVGSVSRAGRGDRLGLEGRQAFADDLARLVDHADAGCGLRPIKADMVCDANAPSLGRRLRGPRDL